MYREWLGLQPVDKTYQNFKTMFAREYQLQNEMKEVTSNEIGYSANVVVQQENPETGELVEALEHFAHATTSDREAFQQLTCTNAVLEEKLSEMYAQNINLAHQLNQRPTYVPPVMPTPRPKPYYQPWTPSVPTQGTQSYFQTPIQLQPAMPPHSQAGL